jgi:hypothetical protein
MVATNASAAVPLAVSVMPLNDPEPKKYPPATA